MNTPAIKYSSPLSILTDWKHNPHVDAFLTKENKLTLDIGCAVPWELWNLYHDVYNMNWFCGYEAEREGKIVKDWLARIDADYKLMVEKHRSELKTVFDIYRLLYVPKASQEDPLAFNGKPALMTREQFKKAFQLTYGERWDPYDTYDKLFDYVILSNVLHLQKDLGKEQLQEISDACMGFFHEAQNALSRGGLIYIRVPYLGYSSEPSCRHIHFTDATLREFIGQRFQEIDLRIEPSSDGLVKNASIVYLGTKR